MCRPTEVIDVAFQRRMTAMDMALRHAGNGGDYLSSQSVVEMASVFLDFLTPKTQMLSVQPCTTAGGQ